MSLALTPESLARIRAALPTMTLEEKRETLALLDAYDAAATKKRKRTNLLDFIKHMDSEYKIGKHHRILAQKLEAAAKGEPGMDRVAVSMAPRMGKSLLLSTYFPAWFIGTYPNKKLIIASHTGDLAVDFGRKVRNIIDSPEFKELFPGVSLAADSKSAGRWNTSAGGEFFAVGVGGAVAGRGAHLCVSPQALLYSARGRIQAADVQIGDRLLGSDGFGEVTAVINSTHAATVEIDGGAFSTEHPIWTANRGWVRAADVTEKDFLQKLGFLERIQTIATRWSFYGLVQKEAVVHHLDDYETTLRKSECCELWAIRRAWGACLRAMGGFVQSIHRGYGRTAGKDIVGSDRPERPIHERELPVGNFCAAGGEQTQQQARYCLWENADTFTVGAGTRRVGHDAGASADASKKSAGRSTCEGEVGLWTKACSLLRQGFEAAVGGVVFPRKRGEGYWIQTRTDRSLPAKTYEILVRLFLGLRHPRRIRVVTHEPRAFVNFTVAEHNTFYVDDTGLTHNCIIDDPHSEQALLAGDYTSLDKVYDWYATGLRTRLMPNGAMVCLHTRWAKNDLIGRLLEESAKNADADQWDYTEFPAILNEGTAQEKSLWPEQWPLELLKRTRATMPLHQFLAQYQQTPTGEAGAIIKREWWKRWTKTEPPKCDYIIMALDPSEGGSSRSDFSALTTWGVFHMSDAKGQQQANVILLNAINKRLEFPELKELCLKEYKEWQPDCFLVEKKSSGAALIQEIRRMNVLISEVTPGRGSIKDPNTKMARMNAVADVVRAGIVWAPEYRWADEVIEQCNDFPAGKNDDICDTVIMCLQRVRQGGLIRLPSDEDWDDAEEFAKLDRTAAYY